MATNKVKLPLLSDDVQHFYRLLFYYEHNIKNNSKEFDFSKLNKFRNKNNITFKYESIKSMKITEHNDENTCVFTKDSSPYFSFIRHLRNAFAHGGISRESNTFVIRDYNNGKLSMYGRIDENLLWGFLKCIRKNVGKHHKGKNLKS